MEDNIKMDLNETGYQKLESFLRSYKSLSWSRNSSPFISSTGSLPYSQQPATGPYPEPDESTQQPHIPFL
jgi:hypothetical protein